MRLVVILFAFFVQTTAFAQQSPETTTALDAAEQHYADAFHAGDFVGAYDIATAARALSAQEFGENNVITLHLMLRQAQAQEQLVGSFLALDMFREVHERWKTNFLKYHPTAIGARMEYARVLSMSGETEQALPMALEALQFAKSAFGGEKDVTVIWKTIVAGMYYELGYLDEAAQTYNEAIEFYRAHPSMANHRRMATQTYELGIMFDRYRETETAAEYWRRGIPLMIEHFGPEHPSTLEARLIYLTNQFRMREYAAMAAAIDDLRPLILKVYGARNMHAGLLIEMEGLLGTTQHEIGTPGFLLATQRTKEAADLYAELIGPGSDKAGRLYLGLANMLIDIKDYAGALDAAFAAETSRSTHRDVLYDALWFAQENGVIDADTAARHAFRISQTSHNGLFKQAVKQQTMEISLGQGKAGRAHRELFERYRISRDQQARLVALTSLPLAKRETSAEITLQVEMNENATKIDALYDYLLEDAPSAMVLSGQATLKLDKAQSLLKPNEAIVILDISAGKDAYHYVIAITRDKAVWRAADATTRDFQLASADVRKGIDLRFGVRSGVSLNAKPDTDDTGFDVPAAEFLYRATFGVVADVIADKDHLLVELRGPMSGLPPALLVTSLPAEGTPFNAVDWMIRDHAITVIASPFSLKTTASAQNDMPTTNSLLAFADPDFGVPDAGVKIVATLGAGQGNLRGTLAPLPETRGEVRAVAAALGTRSATLFEGTAASETTVKSTDLSQFDILYFATHGLVAGDLVSNGKLAEPALALTAGGGEDGLLKYSEISALRLNASLVVLSACNTAIGGEPGAEALSGLAQAFTFAGARSLMVSHWPVESKSAVRLMTDLFARRAADDTLSMAHAQQQAILALIDNQAKPDWHHPAFWAPFILVGSSS